jgi:hypothetical protein
MKRIYFACLFLCLTITFLLSQSNTVPQVNRTPSIASPISASQLPSGRFRAAAHQATPAQASGLNFAPAVAYGSGGNEDYSVAVADVNGDGKPDLLVANYCVSNSNCASGTVGVLLGNGDGTFQTAVAYGSGGGSPYSVAVADVNGDGRPDVLVANASGTVGVLLGNGDGTFQPAVTYASGGDDPVSVAVADVNGDGKPDLLVANYCANVYCENGSLGVLLGNGDGTFQTAEAYDSGGRWAWSVAAADVNGDGKPDLLVVNQCVSIADCYNGTVGVLLGNGDGTFQTAVTYGSGGETTFSVAVADVNGDGKPDLLVANQGGGMVGVLLGNGDGTFQPAVTYGSGGSEATSVAVADVNGDGKPDLLVATYTQPDSEMVGVLLGSGDGTFQPAVTYGSGGWDPFSVAAADVNGDGKPDLLVANYCVSNSNCASGTVGVLINISKYSTTTALASSANPSAFGQSVTFTATVTKQFGNGTPTGTITFTYGSTTLCNTVTLVGGVATCAYSALPVGSDIVTATYSGDANFAPSSSTVSQTVNQANTTLTLTSSVNPSGLDQPVIFTATITPQYGGQATGTVTFKDGATTLGNVVVSGNAASLTTSGLAMGTHSITAVYSGDSNFTGSTSNTVSQAVTKATSTTSLLSSINPSVQGKSVTFTATVSSLAGTPTGKVQFLNGTKVLATLTLTSGSAKYTTSKLPPGSNIITAVYEGDSKNNGSTSAPVNQFVLAATTTTLKSSANPSVYGQTVVFTAKVTSSIGAPPDGETITFKQGGTVLGTGTLSDGTATFSISTLAVGTKVITAVYSGDSNFAGSTSKDVNQVISKATTKTTLTSSQNPSTYGQPVTFTATVAPQFSGTPTGSVVFKDGTKTLKTVALNGGVASYATSTLATGTHTITATYNGSTSFDGSSASLTQNVN